MNESFQHKKSLGQHFLNSDLVPTWLCDAGAVTAGDSVLEIGPGTGALTRELLARGATVIALETDARAVAVLEETFVDALATNQLQLHKHDVRTLAVETLGLSDHAFKVVANIPYYLSGHLFRTLIEHPVQPSDLVFLVQKEVAKRAAAPLPPAPKAKGSLLALSLQVYGTVTCPRTVSRGHFTPPPQVDSAIVVVRHITRDYFDTITEADFFATIRLGYGNKRKQLAHNLHTKYDKPVVAAALGAANLSPTVRAEDISLTQWKTLIQTLTSQNPYTL